MIVIANMKWNREEIMYSEKWQWIIVVLV